MSAVLSTSGMSCCSRQCPLIRGGSCLTAGGSCLTAPRHCRVQRCNRVITNAAARNSSDDASGRNRIGRSMDDNASTDEPWWKVLLGMQKLQQVKSDSKPAGNSLNGKYNVPRPRAAGKSGTVNRYAVGRAAGAKKSSAQPMRRTIANPRPSQRQQARRATDSNRASSVEPLVDDDTFWLDNLYNAWQFDNLYNPWRDEDADRSERRPDTDDCNDGSGSGDDRGWLGRLLDSSSAAGEATADVKDAGGWSSAGDHGTSHHTAGSPNDDTGSSYSSHDTSSHSSSWDAGSHSTHNDSSSYDTSSYDTGSYDAGSYDSGGSDCGGDAGDD